MNFLQEVNIALQNTTLFAVFFFIIGSCLASFFNVVVFRYPKMMDSENAQDIEAWLEEKKIEAPTRLKDFISTINLSFPSSHCYSCNNSLKWYHNIPVLSYLLLRGKCGFCKTPYSIQYPIVEFFGGLILCSSYLYYFPKGNTELFVFASTFFMICYLLLLIDLKTMYLPDTLNYSLMWIGIIGAILSLKIYDITLTGSLYGAITGYMILWIFATLGKKMKGVDVMGGGDLKLVAAIGSFLGVPGALFTIFFSPFIGIFTWIYTKISKKEEVQFPFGPALILASWIYIFYGKEVLRYFNIVI